MKPRNAISQSRHVSYGGTEIAKHCSHTVQSGEWPKSLRGSGLERLGPTMRAQGCGTDPLQ
jgi:hypothetical protein